jgi:hypothetical protein
MRRMRILLSVAVLMALAASVLSSHRQSVVRANAPANVYLPVNQNGSLGQSNAATKIYLPLIQHRFPVRSPFLGFETYLGTLSGRRVQEHAYAAGAAWVRLNGLSWATVQENPGNDFNWSGLTELERDLQTATATALRPLVIVNDTPYWANDALTRGCRAVSEEDFDEFAAFMHAAVERYKNPPYNVHDWEIGNEPDVDPRLVGADSPFGCWGNIDDPYYGGVHYGNMLKAIAPAIRSADPTARIYIGGLLLNNPRPCVPETSPRPAEGLPECFFEGILTTGAGTAETNAFDVVAYHAYAAADEQDRLTRAQSKVQFLKETMARFNVSKPIVLNETALRCRDCGASPPASFEEEKADFAIRVIVRALADGVESAYWYTLNGPGWDHSGLLDASQNPRPAYEAFQAMALQIYGATQAPTGLGDTYGTAVEAYRFNVPGRSVDVAWSKDLGRVTLGVPSGFIAAFDRNGDLVTPNAGVLATDTGVLYVQLRP